MKNERTSRRRLKPIWRAVIEITFIVFLFYANLLMGEFTRHAIPGKTLWTAIKDLATPTDLGIALISAFIGYIGFEYLRRKL